MERREPADALLAKVFPSLFVCRGLPLPSFTFYAESGTIKTPALRRESEPGDEHN
jgi:hypothetical protein